jgi:flagellar export protein FliJ
MAFHFPLQPVLRLRQSLEERERLRLAMIINCINQIDQQCEALDQDKMQTGGRISDHLQAGMAAVELRLERARIISLNQTKKALLQQKAKLEQQRNAQEATLREAQRERKTLEDLREHKLELYRRDWERHEQQRFDDLFGQRLGTSKQS